ncbi:MAG TPA: phosphoserine phosphatase SerB [Beutenbergiaceae bacterium]|nr:phosphoserine phosphatase SerB [Beutenbergiaceae bacterium]
MRRLIVLDVDSTFIQNEQIDLLADIAGSGEEVAAITHRAMSGELDFEQSLKARVATLKGLPATAFDQVRHRISFTPGAVELVEECAQRGWVVALVSGGFHEIIDPLVKDLAISYVRANRLDVVDGHLTGQVRGEVVDRAAKATYLRKFAQTEGIALENTVAIGDGANDLDMLEASGTGVAFAAKPVVANQADVSLPGPRLDGVLAHL